LPTGNEPFLKLIFNIRFWLCLLFIFSGLLWNEASSQNLTVSGTVTDNSSGESLILATIYDEKTDKWTTSNNYGYFSLKLPAGEKKISVSYVGYRSEIFEFNLLRDTVLAVKLVPDASIDEVVIRANNPSQRVLSSQMSSLELPMQKVNSAPFLLGETDAIKLLQLMPGVTAGMEGSSGLYVRGGGPDQNLILLDGVPVYNANHLFGFYSIFNSDAIQSVTLIKGGLPARYGGRLSSVLDIRMKEGNMKEFKGTASIGIISSKLTIEGPLVRERTSFILSGRRTYLDALSYPFQKLMNNDDGNNLTGYYFYDINAKINHKFSVNSRLFVSAYTGTDRYFKKSRYEHSDTVFHFYNKSKSIDELEWGNLTVAVRWNYIFNNTLFSNLTLISSRYKYRTNVENSAYSEREIKGETVGFTEDYRNRYTSSIKDYGLKWDLENRSFPGHYLRGGLNNTIHYFTPGLTIFLDRGTASSMVDTTFGNRRLFTNEFYIYAEDDFEIGSRYKVNLGLHYSNFYTGGKWYHSVEPRFSGRFLVNQDFSIKASYTRLTQYDHLLSNSTIGLPTDMWVPSTGIVGPQKSWQISSGIEYNISDNLELTSEIYYKSMSDLIAYGDGASYFSTFTSWEEKVETGSGKSYGFEVMLQKTKGKFTGWIGYTLSRSTRKFESISFGREFPYTYDRRHDLSVVANYRISDRIDLNGTWVLASGNMITLSQEKYMCMQGLNTMWLLRTGYFRRDEFTNDIGIVDHFDLRNNFRMPLYHRLDVGINFRKTKKHGERTFSLGAYNTYNRLNAFYIYYTYEDNPAQEKVLYKVTLFPFIPYIRYTYAF
jgi:hypothetical protein